MSTGSTQYPNMAANSIDPTRVELLIKAIGLDPDLGTTIEIASRAQGVLSYPIEGHDELDQLFSGQGDAPTFGGRIITREEVRKFVPRSFFPIDSEDDLIHKTYLSLKIGNQAHASPDLSPELAQAGPGLNTVNPRPVESSLSGGSPGVIRVPAASATSFSFD